MAWGYIFPCDATNLLKCKVYGADTELFGRFLYLPYVYEFESSLSPEVFFFFTSLSFFFFSLWSEWVQFQKKQYHSVKLFYYKFYMSSSNNTKFT